MVSFITKNFTVLVVLILGGFLLFGKNMSLLSALLASRGEADNKNDNDSTMSEAAAEVAAENLYNAMSSMGTDETAIDNEFSKMKSQADFNKVFNAFGTRVYSETFGNGGSVPGLSDRYDLLEWLTKELSYSEQQELKKNHPHLNIF